MYMCVRIIEIMKECIDVYVCQDYRDYEGSCMMYMCVRIIEIMKGRV